MPKIIAQRYPNGEIRTVLCQDSGTSRALGNGGESNCAPDYLGGESANALDITSKVRTTHQPNPGFGGTPSPTRFGNNARRTLSRAAGVFDADKIPSSELVFLTGTIPGSTKTAFDALARWSSYAVDLLKSHISKLGVRAAYSMYVWEFQKRGALHIHYCLHVEDPVIRAAVLSGWKRIWTRVIDAVGEKSGVDMWERCDGATWAGNKSVLQADAQIVRKSVGAYLSKYLGKQAPHSAHADADGEYYLCPVRWWSVSRPLMARLKELTEVKVFERVSWARIKYVRESIREALTGSVNPVYNYRDKAKTAEVFVTYDSQNSPQIFNEIIHACGYRGNELHLGIMGSSERLYVTDWASSHLNETRDDGIDDDCARKRNSGRDREQPEGAAKQLGISYRY